MFENRVGVLASAIIALSPFAIWYSQDARPLWFVFISRRARVVGFASRRARTWLENFYRRQRVDVSYALRCRAVSLRPSDLRVDSFARETKIISPMVCGAIYCRYTCCTMGHRLLFQRRPLTANSWIPTATLVTPLQTIWNFVSGDATQWTLLMMIGVIVLVALMITGARTFSVAAQLLMWWLVLPILTAWAFSIRLPAYIDRFFEPALLSVALLLASGLMAVPSSRLRTLMIALTLIAMSFASTRLFSDSTFTKEDWRGVTQMVRARDLPVTVTDSETMLGMTPYLPSPLGFVPIRSSADLTNQLAQGSFVLVMRSPRESAHALGEAGVFDPLTESPDDVVRWFKTHPEVKITSQRFVGVAVVTVEK